MSSARTVLVTGGTGFLGSHLARALNRAGQRVVVLKRAGSDLARLRGLLPEITLHDADGAPLRTIFEAHRVDSIIHTATSYGRRGERPSEILRTNLLLPMELLELAAEFQVGAFFNADTVLPGGLSYYATTKKQFLEYGRRMTADSVTRLVNVKLEHLYGPGDDGTRFIPWLIGAFLGGAASLDLTEGRQRRDFVYVEDVVDAFLLLGERFAEGQMAEEEFEVGTGEAPALAEVVKLVHRLCQARTELRFGTVPYRGDELMCSESNTAALRQLGWRPRVRLEDGLTQTIQAAVCAAAQ
ncbi:NAD-dependent epimerase/dehydratase family protein [Paludibaculum fermentans]|uniref:NAD-dependent epimerase/dehydratase n=1 Tax=Paludibaculum fermentans TaxID=1473598 RepID=A0A7S7SI60_PALFE|nr:NAD-dependent epimerase/dehydratase [Paludibaculum fermentans]QOY85101.1 NAD-dependent epimerase/dehydratase [Paludibaculum fermentans]